MPFHAVDGLHLGTSVFGLGRALRIPVGTELLGRVIDGIGEPIDGAGPIRTKRTTTIRPATPSPFDRPKIEQPFVTGQRVIDGLLTCGRGQRMGLFAGSGVGKSTLLGEVAKGALSDLNVIALIGERGREVRPFLDDCLGKRGLERSVVIVTTSDQSPLMRVRAAQSAVAIASYFRQLGANVLFLLDSLTRMATAQREIGILLGEPPSARGFTPSVFQLLAATMEQLGQTPEGSITALLTVLVDGDDMDEPVSDAVRSILDGHIVMDRQLAEKGHFPAIDVSRSISRVMTDVVDQPQRQAAQSVRSIIAHHAEVQDLIRVGAYKSGGSPEIDRSLQLMPVVSKFVQQTTETYSSMDDTGKMLSQLHAAWKM